MIFNNLVSPSVFDVLLVFITLLGISFCLIAVLKLHLLFIIIILFYIPKSPRLVSKLLLQALKFYSTQLMSVILFRVITTAESANTP